MFKGIAQQVNQCLQNNCHFPELIQDKNTHFSKMIRIFPKESLVNKEVSAQNKKGGEWLTRLFDEGGGEENSGVNSANNNEKRDRLQWALQGVSEGSSSVSLSYKFGNDIGTNFTIYGGGLKADFLANNLTCLV